MFATSNSPTRAYADIGVETGVMGANPHKLILMLFDGALLAVAVAKDAMQSGKIAEKGQSISRSIDIVNNGLKASLDFEAGADMAQRLAGLYDYISARLLQANLRDDQAALDEVRGLLQELRSAWEEIAKDPSVVSVSKPAK